MYVFWSLTLSPCQRVSNDSSVAMLSVAAGAVRSRSTRILPATSALNTLLNRIISVFLNSCTNEICSEYGFKMCECD